MMSNNQILDGETWSLFQILNICPFGRAAGSSPMSSLPADNAVDPSQHFCEASSRETAQRWCRSAFVTDEHDHDVGLSVVSEFL
ncbi:hypothetical protein NL676_008239 [Syzygium grande]|nr:hypothetical protein NL676_008239 [Syzygium grande]